MRGTGPLLTRLSLCDRVRVSKWLLLAAFLGSLGAAAVDAQLISQRILPAKGERGRTGEAQPLPMVKINGRVLRLAPGGVIVDRANRTLVHGHLPADADVLYTKDSNGDVQRIYILTEQEQARLERAGKR
jgi:hypothetical protein